MGLFSKHKDNKEEKTNSKAAPPAPPAMGKDKDNAPMPPAPPMAPNDAAPTAAPSPDSMPSPPAMGGGSSLPSTADSNVPDGSNLSPPPLPGGTLDDIKKQVSEGMEIESGDDKSEDNEKDETKEKEDNENGEEKNDSENLEDESLFDMFDMKFPNGKTDLDKKEDTQMPPKEEKPKLEIKEEPKVPEKKIDEAKDEPKIEEKPISQSNESPFEDIVPNAREMPKTSPSHPTNTSLENLDKFNFENNPAARQDSTFLTTDQFKLLLEIIDSVKARVKSSSEIHLRMMDMKSEEDIEYENLRKNFQFIEDKLYDLDSIIFEK